MKNFMEPKSVALFGITRKSGPESFNLIENMRNYGFSGKIFPINPHAKEILGEMAYPNIRAINEKIEYGDVDGIAELLRKIAGKEGPGATLAEGIVPASRKWGLEDIAIHVKGLEPAGYDPRVLKGMGLAYGTSDRGACHLRATFYKPELAKMIDPDQIEGKAEMFAEWEDRLIIFDALILCRFYRDLYQWEELAAMIKAVTGFDLDKEGMRSIARNISDETRRFNLREGLTPEGDKLPKRFHTEVLPETQKIITEEEMDRLLKDYYKVRGWDEEGVPPAMS